MLYYHDIKTTKLKSRKKSNVVSNVATTFKSLLPNVVLARHFKIKKAEKSNIEYRAIV